jgi:hypothetical protein
VGTGHRVAIVLTPILAIATLAVGMRVGARRTVHAAIVYGAPRAHGATAFAWRVVTLVEEDGEREGEQRSGVTVHARAKGKDATWKGDSNEDGVAEARLELPGVARGDAIELEVLGDGMDEPLAKGSVAWDDAAWMNEAPGPFVRPSKREGAIALDVAVLGQKLVTRGDVPLMIRATSRDDGHPVGGVTIVADPDPGLEVRAPSVTTCALGWARLPVSPRIYIAALGLHAKHLDGRTGEWFGPLPVASGSIYAMVPDVVKGDEAQLGVQARTLTYAEIDDADGRAFADWTKLPGPGGDRAWLHPPPLSPGLKWFVTSSEPHPSEAFVGAAIARPFLVTGANMPAGVPSGDDPCAVGAYLALHPAGGFHHAEVLDGFVSRKDANGERKRRGLAIGLTSLAIATVLELVLLLQTARRGRGLAPDAIAGLAGSEALMKRSGAGSVVVGVLLTVLGFGLIAAILLVRS